MLMRVLCIAIIEPLLQGAKVKLLASGVREENIVVQSVPGSWELPIACSKCVCLPVPPLLLELEICFDSDSTLICINNNT
jgi:hypothetical protein